MLSNILLIARREYLERVRTRSFLVATILIPVLMAAGIGGSILIAKHSKSNSHLAVVSSDTRLASDLQNELEHGKDSAMTVDVISPPSDRTRTNLDDLLKRKDLDGYLWISPPRSAGGRPVLQYKQGSSADMATRSSVQHAIDGVLTRERLMQQGLSQTQVDDMMKPAELESTDTGEADHTEANFAAAYVTFFLMYMVIMLYGMNVARSIIEEKTSRVFEVMLATVKPLEMMAGKVIGVGSVGLTQVGIWMLAAVLLTHTSIIAHYMGGGAASGISFSAAQVIFFIVYFLMGYLLYSAMAAALGAMTNSEQELQQLNMFLVLPLAGCMVALPLILNSPGSPWSRLLSLIPFCTPLLMYMRISVSPVPWYEIAASLAIMAVTIYAILWITSRIYRVGILMYGKKPNLPEIIRWVKYSA